MSLRRRPTIFFLIIGTIELALILSIVFVSRQILRITHDEKAYHLWLALCAIFQTPFLIIPLDRGRLLGILGRHFPLSFFLGLTAWNITQMILLLTSPLLLFMPDGWGIAGYFPFALYLVCLVIAFASVFNVREREIKITVPSWPSDWKPLTILHVSDIHSGPFMRKDYLNKLVERLAQKSFDMCVVTGDVVNHSAREIGWTLEAMEKITSPLGTFSIMGNHEYIDDEKAILEAYKNAKLKFLLNDSTFVSDDHRKIRMIGIDFPFEDSDREIAEALKKSAGQHPPERDEFKILLSHHPNEFDRAVAHNIPVTLSGHTHGGQLEVMGKNVLRKFEKYVRGLYRSGGSYLYVNAGLGNWMPFRVGVPCEYALITICNESAT